MSVGDERGLDSKKESTQIAVFVDSENVSSHLTWEALGRMEAVGRVGYVELLGDSTNLWPVEKLRRHYPVRITHVPCGRKGGQSADFSLVIAVMNNLGSSAFSTYAIVSSDQDFYPLVLELKSKGKTVLAAGESKTSKVYRNAADTFIELGRNISRRKFTEDDDEFLRVVESACSGGWIDLPALGRLLRNEISGFSADRFGSRNLSALLRSFPERIEIATLGASGSELICRYIK